MSRWSQYHETVNSSISIANDKPIGFFDLDTLDLLGVDY